MQYQHIKIPVEGKPISINHDQSLNVPDQPIIPFIEGDGVGVDITPVMRKVVDAAIKKVYKGQKKIYWMEVFNGEKAALMYDGDWFPQETITAIKEHKIAIKGPLTTPIGGGFRSLNIALRQEMDLYVNIRQYKWFQGSPSPLKSPEKTNMVVFRDNSEDIYTGIEFKPGSQDADRVIEFLQYEMGTTKIRFNENCGIGIKNISEQGSKRIIRKAIQYAITHKRKTVTLIHKGNVMKFTEGAFKQWGYEVAVNEFDAKRHKNQRWLEIKRPDMTDPIIIKDVLADNMLQQIILRPEDYDVIATMNLNGDYLGDALAAQVGGIGIAPSANMNDDVAFFEPTHGTVPRYAGLDKVNPSSIILCAQMMLTHIGWHQAAALLLASIEKTILDKTLTCDFAKLVSHSQEVSCSEFGDALIANMKIE